MNPRPDGTKEGGVLVEIKIKEQDPKSADVETVWNFVPGDQGRPTLVMCLHTCNLFYSILLKSVLKLLGKFIPKMSIIVVQVLLLNLMHLYLSDGGFLFQASIQPGGGVTFEHRNICGLNISLAGSFSSSNLLNPQVSW